MMRKNFTPRSVALTAIPLLFGIYVVPASAAISLGTITFDAAGTEHQQPLGPFFETTSGVLMTLTTDNHLHLGDRSGDGNPDLYNHNNITQTLTFSQPVSFWVLMSSLMQVVSARKITNSRVRLVENLA